MYAQGAKYYYTRDHLGSIREMVDSSGNVKARYDYDPYGRRTANQVSSGAVEADFGFTGHYFHAPSGLQFALFRAYDSNLGRWLNGDPLGLMAGANLYRYVRNNPVKGVDRYGLADNYSLMGMAGPGMADFANAQGLQALSSEGQAAQQVGYNGSITSASGDASFENASQEMFDQVLDFYVGVAVGEGIGIAFDGVLELGMLARGVKWGARCKKSVGLARDAIGLSKRIQRSGMTNAKAGDFFGWGDADQITKPLSDFTAESLTQAGWTKDVLLDVADGYRQMAEVTPQNVAAPVRAAQLEALSRLFK